MSVKAFKLPLPVCETCNNITQRSRSKVRLDNYYNPVYCKTCKKYIFVPKETRKVIGYTINSARSYHLIPVYSNTSYSGESIYIGFV